MIGSKQSKTNFMSYLCLLSKTIKDDDIDIKNSKESYLPLPPYDPTILANSIDGNNISFLFLLVLLFLQLLTS